MASNRRRLIVKQPQPSEQAVDCYIACRVWRGNIESDITHRRSLLGIFRSPQAAYACASQAELQFSWKEGSDAQLCVQLRAEQEVKRQEQVTVACKIVGRIIRDTGDLVHYRIAVQSHEDLKRIQCNALLYNRWGFRGRTVLLPGSSLLCSEAGASLYTEVPHRFLDMKGHMMIGDKCYTDNGCEKVSDDHPSRMHFSVSSFKMPTNCEMIHVYAVFWGSAHCAPDDFKIFPEAALANVYASTCFCNELNNLKSELKARHAVSGLKEVDVPVYRSVISPFKGIAHKHCFSSGYHEGLFAGGLSDFRTDDLGDLTLGEVLDFSESSQKFFLWVERVPVNEARQLGTIARYSQFIHPGVLDNTENGNFVGCWRPAYAAIKENGATFHPGLQLLGVFSDALDARRVTAHAEHKNAYKARTKVRVEVCRSDMDIRHCVSGRIRKRIQDDTLLHGFGYLVDIDFDDDAKKLGAKGASLLPTWKSPRTGSGGEQVWVLNAGVAGDTSSLVAPRSLINRMSEDIYSDSDKYEVRVSQPGGSRPDAFPAHTRLARLLRTNRCGLPKLPVSIQNLLFDFVASDLWAAFYEPSLTGWGDACKFELFWTPDQANQRVCEMFRGRMNRLRLVDSPDHLMGFRERTKSPLKFRLLPPGKMLCGGYPKIRKFKKAVGENWLQCFTKAKREGLAVAAIFNSHGDHLGGNDGTMSEWFWVEKVHIAGAQSDSSSKAANSNRSGLGRRAQSHTM